MPPFRLVTRDPAKGSPNGAWHPIGGVYGTMEDLEEALEAPVRENLAEVAPVPGHPTEERAAARLADRVAELDALGYEFKRQELVVADTGTDDAGTEVATAHKWKDA